MKARDLKAIAGEGMAAMAPADAEMLDVLQQRAFDYFVKQTQPHNGLVADTSRPGSPASIAVVGFALVDQQMPRTITDAPPSAVTVPPLAALVVAMPVTADVVIVGAVGAADVVKVTSDPYDVPTLFVA